MPPIMEPPGKGRKLPATVPANPRMLLIGPPPPLVVDVVPVDCMRFDKPPRPVPGAITRMPSAPGTIESVRSGASASGNHS